MRTTYLIFLSLILLFSSCSDQPQDSYSPDRYTVHFDSVNPKLVLLEAEIALEDSLLYMSANGPIPERWPQYVRNLKVKNGKGEELPFELRDSTAWIIKDVVRGQKISLSYEIVLDHEEQDWPGGIDGVAFVRDWGLMASGRALFVLNGESKTDIQVDFRKPEHWKVSVPWKEAAGAIYTVPNLIQLQESLLFAGTHEETAITRENFSLKFVLGGEAIVRNKEQYTNMAREVLDYYIELMGGIPKPEPGNDLSQVLVMINQSKEVDGEVIGNHISMLLNPEAAPQEQMVGWFIFAHEFFHLWNGKTLRYNGTKMDWFKEGVTNYYTLKGLHQVGFADEEVIKMVLNNLFYQRYINDPGYGKLAPSEAASGFDKDNHWGLIYGGGLFAGICMDMEIRHNTENAKSLDDGMRFFYEEFGGTEKTITNDDILNQVNTLGNTDFSDLMNACVLGNHPVPLADYLQFAGMEVDTSDQQLVLIQDQEKDVLEQKLWSGFLGEN